METIKSILYDIFDQDAIYAAAMVAMGNDIRCKREYPAEMTEQEFEAFDRKYEGRWPAKYTEENAKKFQRRVDALRDPHDGSLKLYDGLTETEHFAVRKFYYFNSY